MKKRLQYFSLCVMMILFCLAGTAHVLADAAYGDFQCTLNNSTGEVEITGYTGAGGSVVIPAYINGFPVTSIKSSAFLNNTGVTKVSFAAGSKMTTLGWHAFEGCTGLVSIELPDTVREIRVGCFLNCTSLASIVLPEGLTGLGAILSGCVFKGCTSLASVKLPSTLTYIGEENFADCKSLKQLTIPDTVTEIYHGAFAGSGLTSITLPEGVTQINYDMFLGCTALKTVKLSPNVVRIGGKAFMDCSALESVNIPVDLKVIDTGVFHGCTSLKTLTFGDVVESLAWGSDWNLFHNCPNLTVRVVRGTKLAAYCFNYGVRHEVYASSLAGCTVEGIVDKTYDGSEQKQNPEISAGSEKLKLDTDYTVAYSGNVNAGKATMVITGIGNYVGKLTKTFTINTAEMDQCKLKLSKKSMVYAAKYLEPSVTVTFRGKKLSTTNYSVSYSRNFYVGTATVTISGTGNFRGSRQLTFTIVPKAVKMKKVKALSKGFQASWKENKIQTSGYELQYSLKKNFKSAKKINVPYYNKTSQVVQKLKGGRKYYVRVRCYHTVYGKKYYSAWSKAVTVKTKK